MLALHACHWTTQLYKGIQWHQANQKQQTVLHEKYGMFSTKSGRHECVPVIGVVLAAHVHQHHVLVLDLAVCGKGQSQCGALRHTDKYNGCKYMDAAQIHATAAWKQDAWTGMLSDQMRGATSTLPTLTYPGSSALSQR